MRIHIKTSPNNQPVDFDYQVKLTGAIHKWLGPNQVHDQTSLYSFSWLNHSRMKQGKLDFPQGASWFISVFDPALLKQLVRGIQESPTIAFGMVVQDLMIQETPAFDQGSQAFRVASPVFIKRARQGPSDSYHQFYYYNDEQADQYLTESLKFKLSKVGLTDDTLQVNFDRSYTTPSVKKVNYKGIHLKASFCPVTISGQPESIAFAWDVGVGSATGIGFGSLL